MKARLSALQEDIGVFFLFVFFPPVHYNHSGAVCCWLLFFLAVVVVFFSFWIVLTPITGGNTGAVYATRITARILMSYSNELCNIVCVIRVFVQQAIRVADVIAPNFTARFTGGNHLAAPSPNPIQPEWWWGVFFLFPFFFFVNTPVIKCTLWTLSDYTSWRVIAWQLRSPWES